MSRGIVGAPARYQDVADHHAPRPVIAVAGEGTDLAAINDNQGAVAVIFELVNPSESYLIAEYRWFWPIRGIRWF
jgi:hypothetical protein